MPAPNLTDAEVHAVMEEDRRDKLLRAIYDDGRYPPGAYIFVQDGLEFTNKMVDSPDRPPPRHVTGRELCEGLRELALRRWGMLARAVLNQWNIRGTRDFGEIVYFLVEFDQMATQESDTIADFDEVFDFDEAFDSYMIPLDAEDE
ncbi:MAG: hypothetical protein PVJ57_04720 [Phycisphaerae bacterium]